MISPGHGGAWMLLRIPDHVVDRTPDGSGEIRHRFTTTVDPTRGCAVAGMTLVMPSRQTRAETAE
ncbi:MAG: hypothetical protein F4X92_05030 [Gammaproteobacteria bacterium]|nr:hypothetical protein [Gammaproteobacteria bacterium]